MIFLPAKQSSGGSSLSVGLTDRENHHVSCSEVLSKTPSIFIISYSIKSPEEWLTEEEYYRLLTFMVEDEEWESPWEKLKAYGRETSRNSFKSHELHVTCPFDLLEKNSICTLRKMGYRTRIVTWCKYTFQNVIARAPSVVVQGTHLVILFHSCEWDTGFDHLLAWKSRGKLATDILLEERNTAFNLFYEEKKRTVVCLIQQR